MKLGKAKLLALTALLAIGGNTATAQQLQAKLSHYSTEDGLASNSIAQIKQDGYGYLWIATWNGLSRFDGYNFYNYQTGPASHIPNLHNRIWDIAIDNQQNVWMRMYDQRIFVVKRSNDCFVNPFENVNGSDEFRVSTPITVTSNGDVLVTVDNVGIYKMRVEQDNISAQLITTAGLNVTSMAEGYQNDIWLGTNEGIHRLDASNLTIERKGIFLDEKISCLYSNGYNIFAGTQSGKIVTFSYGQEPSIIRQGGLPVISIFVDSHGLIWFADSRMGASRLIVGATNDEKFFTQDVRVPDYDSWGAFFSETNGIVWVRMNKGGYGYYNREEDKIHYFHNDPENPWNLSNTMNAQLELNEGVVWESTIRRGMEKLEIINKTIERIRPVPDATTTLDNEIRGLYYDQERKLLLMANKNSMLFVFDANGSKTIIRNDEKGKPLGRIYGIMKDSKGNYWLSSKDYGLFKMTLYEGGRYSMKNYQHEEDNSESLSDNRAYNAVEDAEGNIWVATYGGGVNMLVKDTHTFLSPKNKMRGYPHHNFMKVRDLAIDKEGKVWAGTTDGILIMSYKSGRVTIEQLQNSEEEPEKILLSNDVVCLGNDKQGGIWVGTNGGGLAHTIGKDSEGCWLFEHFGSKDGLPSEEIRSITFDNRGNVWFDTDNIICSFDTSKNIFSMFSSLEGVDETTCSEGSAVTMPNDIILFGTTDGYYRIDRQKLENSSGSVLKLRFTDFWLNGELQSPRKGSVFPFYVPDAKSIELPSHDDQFALRFVSLNYQLQHRVHYQYMLEGYDDEWNNASKDRTATYADLPAGTYKLKVKAFLLESPEKYDQKEITIVVPSAFLFSKSAIWIYLLLAAIIGVGILFGRQYYLRNRGKKSAKGINNADSSQDNVEFMKQVNEWLEQNYAKQKLSIDQLLAHLNMGRAELEEKLMKAKGLTPKDLLTNFRIEKAKEMLEQTNNNVADISFSTGFPDSANFTHHFQQITGMTPSKYRDEARAASGDHDDYELIED
ncbi:MAG: helix-turn-helix domain-containing protein [Prevotella sp.]|nr:helix-turn-helix domain-containing protein [Prevotella sp.]